MFNLTHQERRVILFLIIVALAGISIDLLLKKYSRLQVIACAQQDAGLVNLNKADIDELKSLPGIGDKLAKAIIDYRSARGGFKNTQELLNVKRIYPSRFEKIKSRVKIE
ncbi:MAG: helix-hairpin-helix domain-containing protein [Candidatus Omnitrophota bacterium]